MDASNEEQQVPDRFFNTELWIDHLCELAQGIRRAEKRLVVVVIARKMARLMEYHFGKSDKLKSWFTFEGNNCFSDETESGNTDGKPFLFPIITEHAIPFFLDCEGYQDNKDDKPQVVIVDDLIVYGDTVETVSENIYAQTGIESQIIAMASSTGFDEGFRYAKMYKTEKRLKLEKEDIPAFTAKCSRDILSMKGAIDLEHTILKITLNPYVIHDLKANLESCLRECFPLAQVYKITHLVPQAPGNSGKEKEEAVNITVNFGPEGDNINNDFNKLRFFIGDEELKVVSYAPNIWLEEDLERDKFDFLSPGLNKSWQELKATIDQLKFCVSTEGDAAVEYKLRSGFEKRKELSKVVWANYLCSFENILRNKGKIIEAIRKATGIEPKLGICKESINLLIGSKSAKKIYGFLEEELLGTTYDPKKPYIRWMSPSEKADPLVPASDRLQYIIERSKLVDLAPSVSTSLSLIFEYLRVEYGLINNRHKEDRITVGETFESLGKAISNIYSREDFLLEIHKWIDERIDLGVVVPKYERFDIPLGNRAWRRFFRPGERIDILKDVCRLAQWLIDNGKLEADGASLDVVGENNEKFCNELQEKLNWYNSEWPNQVPLEAFSMSSHRIKESKIGYSLSLTVLKYYAMALKSIRKRINSPSDEEKPDKKETQLTTSLFRYEK